MLICTVLVCVNKKRETIEIGDKQKKEEEKKKKEEETVVEDEGMTP